MAEQENLTKYELNEMTDITQYNVEDVYKDWSDSELAFGKPKTFVPVFHWLQPKPGEGWEPVKIELYEWHVEIGWPTQTPWDTEEFDDQILAQSWREKDIHPDAISITPASWIAYLWNPASKSIPFNKFDAIVTPTEYEFPVIWSASPRWKVTIDNGVVTPIALWEDITITATSWAFSATATVTVEKIAVTWVTLNETELSLEVWNTSQLEATIAPAWALVKDVAWSSSNTNVATVENWLVTAVADGKATITVTSTDDNTKTATCTVTVVTETP